MTSDFWLLLLQKDCKVGLDILQESLPLCLVVPDDSQQYCKKNSCQGNFQPSGEDAHEISWELPRLTRKSTTG